MYIYIVQIKNLDIQKKSKDQNSFVESNQVQDCLMLEPIIK